MYALPNGQQASRLGITVTRKVGGAVVRNRIKRRLREIFRRWQELSPSEALDIVLHARPSAARASFGELEREATKLLERICGR